MAFNNFLQGVATQVINTGLKKVAILGTQTEYGSLLAQVAKKELEIIGGPTKTVYDFVKKDNPNIKKIYAKRDKKLKFPINSSMNLKKLRKALNNKN